jgi:hypothetical protein
MMSGLATAIPLLRHGHVGLSLQIYAAVTLLSALLVPKKSMTVGYAGFFGLYPIVKYGIECRAPRRTQTVCKLAFFNLVLVAAFLLVRNGLFPGVTESYRAPLAVLWFAVNVVFLCYDVGLSRFIALLRRRLPPD